MTRRTLIALGIGQCVNWGVLYYAFAVLLVPLQRELGLPAWIVTGAFSLALLTSAIVAPRIGQWCDAGRGSTVMQAGGFSAAILLSVWTLLPGVVVLYVVWTALGVCMAATLYEPAFVIVGRSYLDPGRRLRALAALTLFGGLASTVFLPLTALLVEEFGWRSAVLVLAAMLLVSTSLTRALALRDLEATDRAVAREPHATLAGAEPNDPPHFFFASGLFALAALASSGYTANLVPALSERGISPGSAALLGGLIGIMQLPGRALLMHGALGGASSSLLTLSLALLAVGLLGAAFAPSLLVATLGTSVFALGAGLTTLVRPQLVEDMTGGARSGYINGRIARHQQFARAAGPLLIAWLAALASYTAVIATVAAVFILCAAAWRQVSASSDAETRRLPQDASIARYLRLNR